MFNAHISSSAACVWSVCVARKAPLVASDSSSSNSSDSDEEEGKTESSTSETITTGAGKETIRLTVDAKNERAVFSRYIKHTTVMSCSVLIGTVYSLSLIVLFTEPLHPKHFPPQCYLHLFCFTSDTALSLSVPFDSRVFRPAVRRYVVLEVLCSGAWNVFLKLCEGF